MDAMEAIEIKKILDTCGMPMTKAAERIGVKYKTLWRWQRHGAPPHARAALEWLRVKDREYPMLEKLDVKAINRDLPKRNDDERLESRYGAANEHAQSPNGGEMQNGHRAEAEPVTAATRLKPAEAEESARMTETGQHGRTTIPASTSFDAVVRTAVTTMTDDLGQTAAQVAEHVAEAVVVQIRKAIDARSRRVLAMKAPELDFEKELEELFGQKIPGLNMEDLLYAIDGLRHETSLLRSDLNRNFRALHRMTEDPSAPGEA